MRRTALWLAFTVFGFLPARLSAQEVSDEARAAVGAAQALYEGGRFDEAGPAFEHAYELTRHPSMLYNAYVSYRDASLPRESLRTLRQYLEVAPADDPDRPLLQARLEALEASLEREDGPADPPPDPGPGEPDPPPAPVASSGPDLLAPAIVLGIGGAALATGLVLGAVTAVQHDDFSARCGTGPCPELEGDASSGRALGLAADVVLAVGGAVAIAGLIWLVVELTGSSDEEGVACGAAGCGGRF